MKPKSPLTAADYKALLAREMREEELARQIIEFAQANGWRVKRDPTWRPTCADPGYPDLTMVRKGRAIVAELKREGKEPTAAQEGWLAAWRSVPFVEVYVWKPSDLLSGEIERMLT